MRAGAKCSLLCLIKVVEFDIVHLEALGSRSNDTMGSTLMQSVSESKLLSEL